MKVLEIVVPLIITADTFALSAARQQRITTEQREATAKWLGWHLGNFATYALPMPVRVTLTLQTFDAVAPEMLRDYLESTRAGVSSWIFHNAHENGIGVQWDFEQGLKEQGRSASVAISFKGAEIGEAT